jgi:hypothetical protein
MQAVESLVTNLFATKEERANFVKDTLGSNPANRPFYWKQREDGKKLVWATNHVCSLTNFDYLLAVPIRCYYVYLIFSLQGHQEHQYPPAQPQTNWSSRSVYPSCTYISFDSY